MAVTPARHRGGMTEHRTDATLAAMAAMQWGLVTIDQVHAAGGGSSLVRRRLRAGRWAQVGHHVFRIEGAPASWQQRLLAAVLDAGPDAVATSSSAAALWRLPGFNVDVAEVLVPTGTNHRPQHGRLHQSRTLPAHHTTVTQGVPVITPARLVVELAARTSPRRVERAAENAIAASILTPDALASVVSELAGRGRRGSTLLRTLVEGIAPGYVPPASELEARFRDLVRSAGIGGGVTQVDVGGEEWEGRVDVAFPAAKLVVELDSRRWHQSRSAMESDRRRDNALVMAGWRVVRITWRQILDDPVGVVALLRSLLADAAAAA